MLDYTCTKCGVIYHVGESHCCPADGCVSNPLGKKSGAKADFREEICNIGAEAMNLKSPSAAKIEPEFTWYRCNKCGENYYGVVCHKCGHNVGSITSPKDAKPEPETDFYEDMALLEIRKKYLEDKTSTTNKPMTADEVSDRLWQRAKEVRHLRQQHHYARYKIQPVVFIAENNLDFLTGNIIKYVLRHDAKDGVKDLEKAKHYLDMLIQKTRGETVQP